MAIKKYILVFIILFAASCSYKGKIIAVHDGGYGKNVK